MQQSPRKHRQVTEESAAAAEEQASSMESITSTTQELLEYAEKLTEQFGLVQKIKNSREVKPNVNTKTLRRSIMGEGPRGIQIIHINAANSSVNLENNVMPTTFTKPISRVELYLDREEKSPILPEDIIEKNVSTSETQNSF